MMTERRRDFVLHRRVTMAAILGAAGVALRIAEKEGDLIPSHFIWTWIAGCLLVACVVLAIKIFSGNFQCRQCGAKIPRPDYAEGDQMTFHCSRCNIEWDTGWRVPWDSSS
jgi:hypothetical protein